MACLSEKGKMLIFALDELRMLGNGGRGVILMGLDDKESLLAAQPISEKSFSVSGKGRGGKQQEHKFTHAEIANHAGTRARKGRKVNVKFKPEKLVGN